MLSKTELAEELQQIAAEPMTPGRLEAMAHMAYLYMHFQELPLQEAQESVHALTEAEAREWVRGMENADGTTGAHWPMEQTEAVRLKQGYQLAPLPFWVTMNMMYSDYCRVAEKLGVSTAEFYACMARAFLEDKDAKPDKLARYREYVAE